MLERDNVMELLVEIRTKLDVALHDVRDHETRLRLLEKYNSRDHETRLRALEKSKWIAVGLAAAVGGTAGKVIGLV
jgi:ElaB/YqjD/DUF883 family membrane-anchored ribosome-binding protein